MRISDWSSDVCSSDLNWNPIWPNHGIRIIPGPSSMWFDATGKRLPVPNFPGFDTMGTFKYILDSGHEYTWFILDLKIIEKEFALSEIGRASYRARVWKYV